MSYEISYRRRAFWMSPAQSGHYDQSFFLLEEMGSNNCWEIGNRRRARSWNCLAVGSHYECLAGAVEFASACCGGSLVLYGRRHTEPEAYIRAWRKALAAAQTFDQAGREGFHLQLFTRMSEEEAANGRQYAFEQLTKQTLVRPGQHTALGADGPVMEWRFDLAVPEQVKLWLDTRRAGRGWHSVEVYGPS